MHLQCHFSTSKLKEAYDALNAYMNDVNNGNIDFDSYYHKQDNNFELYNLKGFEFAKYTMDINQAYKVVLSVGYDHPEYFWLATSYFSFTKGTNTLVWYPVVYEKYCTREKRADMKEKLQDVIDREYGSIFQSDLSDYEKEKKIHDKVAFGTLYDPNYNNYDANVDSHNIVGVLIDHVAVCEGYAKTMQLLLNKSGIKNVYIVGTSRGEGHAWNKVKLGGNYYNLDSTWDSNNGNYHWFNKKDDNFGNHSPSTPSDIKQDYLYEIPQCTEDDSRYNISESPYSGTTQSISISPNNITLTSKASYYLNLDFAPENAANRDVTWHSSNESVVKVINNQLDGHGKRYSVLVPVSNGSARVTCSLTDSPEISSNVCNVTVDIPDTRVSSITLPESITFTEIGQCKKITPIIAPDDAVNKIVKWRCSNNKFTVDMDGNVTALTNAPDASAIVTCTSLSNPSVSAACTVKIQRNPSIKYIDSINMINNNINIDLSQGNTYDLKGNLKIRDTAGNDVNVNEAPLKWKDEWNKSDVLKVDENTGVVTALKAGTTTISCSAQDRQIYNDDTGTWNRISGTCTIIVKGTQSEVQPGVNKVTGITLSDSAFTLVRAGETKTITAEVSPSDAADKSVTWKSSNPSVATVDGNGKVTAVGNGTADITCKANDGSGISAKITVTVKIDQKSSKKAIKKCSISGTERVGKTLKVTVKDEDNDVVTKDLNYTWYRLNDKDSNDKKEVGDKKTYKLRSGDKNKYIEVVVTDSNNNEVSDITDKIK